MTVSSEDDWSEVRLASRHSTMNLVTGHYECSTYQRGRSAGVAGVHDDLVSFVEKGGGGGSAQSLGGTGDQDASHEGSLVRLVS